MALRLSVQRPEKHYFSKFALRSFERNSGYILVNDHWENNDRIGLAVGHDTVYMIKRPEIQWDVVKILIDEKFYYVPKEYLKPLEKEPDDNEQV